ncbi:MAG TPA: formate dehydrogenase accessory protein FdhE [Methylomirabilota bacterium]|jgi:FdhE protein
MGGLQTEPVVAPPWAARRRRARELRDRWPHAAEMLRLYAALLDVHEPASRAAVDDRPAADEVAAYVAARVLPAVVAATIAAGPPALVEGVRGLLNDPEALVRRWLAGEEQPPVAEYLARAASIPVLEALGALSTLPRSTHDGGCPRCGGRPQLSYFVESGEALVSAPRHLLCSRCSASWIHERAMCPACGERSSAKLSIFSDVEGIPALRADACETCRRYLITVDGRKDAAVVPIVDELVALPLDLHARERGFVKIVPNLMGI